MFQIDWENSSIRTSMQAVVKHSRNHKNQISLRSRYLAIVTLLGVQVVSISIIPNAIFAETKSSISISTSTSESISEDIPEEVLRAEIYTDARSPIDGTQLSAAEYTELMQNLQSLDNIPPEDLVPPKVREVIGLLKLRKFLKQFIPFIP